MSSIRISWTSYVLTVLLLCWLGAEQTVRADIWYVDENAAGANDGSSWANAFNYLQDGLRTAAPGDVVWVAAGSYRPINRSCTMLSDCTAIASGTCVSGECVWSDDREPSFIIKDLRVYGGFAGSETTLEQRNISCNETTLTGDLEDNDEPEDLASDDYPDFVHRADNSCHVVTIDEGAVADTVDMEGTRLDGVTIRSGHDVCQSPTIAFFSGGGGIMMANAGASISSCQIVDNFTDGWGGAISILADGSGTRKDFVNCRISGNVATGEGGGIFQTFAGGSVNIFNSVIDNNLHGDGGGGASLNSDAENADIAIVNTVVVHNRPYGESTAGGSGIKIDAGSGTTSIVNCTIADNGTANIGQGNGLLVLKADVDVTNSIIWGNAGSTSSGTGRQIKVVVPTTPSGIVEVRWSNVLRVGLSSDRTIDVAPIANVFFKTSTPNDLCPSPNSWANLGCDIGDDPLFRNTSALDYSLVHTSMEESPSIDAGKNALVFADVVDIDGDTDDDESIPIDLVSATRIVDDPVREDCDQAPDPNEDCDDDDENALPIVDMGAYELPSCEDAENCNDVDWCTIDTCDDGLCSNECIERCYGNVNQVGPAEANLDDILAIISAFQDNFSGCGPNGLSGCDIVNSLGCPSTCGSDGVINLDEILAVVAAFSNGCNLSDCPNCCPSEGLLAGGGGDGVGHIGAAEEIVAYLTSAQSSESDDTDGTKQILADAFAIFVLADYSDDEKAVVLEIVQKAQADTEDAISVDLLAQIAVKIAE